MPRLKATNPKKREVEPTISDKLVKKKSKSKFFKKSQEDILPIQISSCEFIHKVGDIILTLQDSCYCKSTDLLLKFEPDLSCSLNWSEATEKEVEEKSCSATCDIPYEILQHLSVLKNFHFVLTSCLLSPGETVIHIYLNPLTFIPLKYAAEPYKNNLKNKILKVLQFFLREDLEDQEEKDYEYPIAKEPIQEAYNCFSNSFDPHYDSPPISHEFLIPRLRTYQVQAVLWMLEQENEKWRTWKDMPKLFVPLTLLDGSIVTFHKYGGFFTSKSIEQPKPCKGGILADEMGLGKTLEVLACILLNPRKIEKHEKELLSYDVDKSNPLFMPADNGDFQFECTCGSEGYVYSYEPLVKCERCGVHQHPECVLYKPDLYDDYLCPACWITHTDPLPSPATLIVSPHSILYQWEQEISRHLKENSLKVFMYLGVKHQRFVNPKFLANHDIVLTSYETFRTEVNYANIHCDKSGLTLRRPKKFLSLPSPLATVEWWRICLDEAQMVESTSTKISQMAAKLHSVNRWCVTGTPVQKSVEDLYGLLSFLDFSPYCVKMWWNAVLKKPFDQGNTSPMTCVLKQIAWRTNKDQVLDLIGLPGLKEVIYKLKFSPIEKLYYEKEHASCRNDFLNKIEKIDCLDTKLKSLDKHILSKVLIPLRKLQQVCCHFQISQGNFIDVQKNKMTTSELLAHLLKTTKYECEDKHRKLIMSMNGLAGIYVIKKDFENAIGTYEKVQKSIEDNQNIFRTDITQQIHTLFHLTELLTNRTQEKESCFTVAQLNEKLKELIETYNAKDKTAVETSKSSVVVAGEEISKVKKDFKMVNPQFPTSDWWCEVLHKMDESSLERLQDILRNAPGKNFFISKSSRAMSLEKIRFISMLYQNAVDLHEIRSKLRSKVMSLAVEPSESAVQSAISCHLRPSTKEPKPQQRCEYCEADTIFQQYERKLFQFAEEENGIRRGTHAEGDFELALKFILNYCKRSHGLSEYVEDGVNELNLMDALKKEFKSIRTLWLHCTEYVSHKDEIEMAKISKRLLYPGETPPDPPLPYILSQYEVQPKLVQYSSEIVSYQFELKKKMGQLFYLQNLEKAENIDRPFDEYCPVCRQNIGSSWSVLQCGHSYCLFCIQRLLSHQTRFTNALGFACVGIRCPVCREFTASKDVYCIDNNKETEQKEVNIEGDYSAKVTAIIRCLLQISEEPNAKSLVFSSFTDFLHILEHALAENNIKCLNLCSKKHFNSHLDTFRQTDKENVLLIPLNFGCNGLNLVEANHVLLLEPVLDPSKHLQAIGRVHRIGQTKLATVHKFVVLETIEENIHTANNSNNLSQSSAETTLKDLKGLFE